MRWPSRRRRKQAEHLCASRAISKDEMLKAARYEPEVFAPMATPRNASAACTLHQYHRPHAAYQELHHVVPQAWQHFLTNAATLVDPRTVAICPTGHRNVHWWLVLFMQQYEQTLAVDVAVRAALERARPPVGRGEVACAKLGMARYLEHGGDLLALCQAGLYGFA